MMTVTMRNRGLVVRGLALVVVVALFSSPVVVVRAWQPGTALTASTRSSSRLRAWAPQRGRRDDRRMMDYPHPSERTRTFRPFAGDFVDDRNNRNGGFRDDETDSNQNHQTMGPSDFAYSRARASSFWGHDDGGRTVVGGRRGRPPMMGDDDERFLGLDDDAERRFEEEEDRRRRAAGGAPSPTAVGDYRQPPPYEQDRRRREIMEGDRRIADIRRRRRMEAAAGNDDVIDDASMDSPLQQQDRRRRFHREEERRRRLDDRRFNPRRGGGVGMDPTSSSSYRRPISNLSFNSEMKAPFAQRRVSDRPEDGLVTPPPFPENNNVGNDPFFDDRRNVNNNRWSPSSFRPNNMNQNGFFGRPQQQPPPPPYEEQQQETFAYQERSMMNGYDDPRGPPPPPPGAGFPRPIHDQERMMVEEDRRRGRWSPSLNDGFGFAPPQDDRRGDRWSPSWFKPDAFDGMSRRTSPETGRPLRPWNPRRAESPSSWAPPSSRSSASYVGSMGPVSSKDFQKGISNQVHVGPESAAERRRHLSWERQRLQQQYQQGNRPYGGGDDMMMDPNYYDDGPEASYYPPPPPYGDGGRYDYPPQQQQQQGRMYPQSPRGVQPMRRRY